MNWDRISKEGYQCTQFSACTIDYRVPGPEFTVKLVKSMVQDSGKKRVIGKKRQYKRQIHILKKKKSSLETQKRKQRAEQCSK